MEKIIENTTLSEVLKISGAEKVLAKYDVPCLTCPFAKMEMERLRMGDICKMYGIDSDKLFEDLNKLNKK